MTMSFHPSDLVGYRRALQEREGKNAAMRATVVEMRVKSSPRAPRIGGSVPPVKAKARANG